MSNPISLESAIRTCKVDTAWADKISSDRFLNPSQMVCPTWNGIDTAGRPASRYGFYAKAAGCHSADDRIDIENQLRPQYMEYVNLDAAGIAGHCPRQDQRMNPESMCGRSIQADSIKQTGQFGTVAPRQTITANCMSCGSRNQCSDFTDRAAVQHQKVSQRQVQRQAKKVQQKKRLFW